LHQSMSTAALPPTTNRPSRVLVWGEPQTERMRWFVDGMERELFRHGHLPSSGESEPNLVINVTDARQPRPYRRRSQGTFVVSIVEVDHESENLLRAAYPLLVRSLSNLLIYIATGSDGVRAHFVTLEQGYYTIPSQQSDSDYFSEVYRAMAPLAQSRLVINNLFEPDLPPELWEGNERTAELIQAGQRLDEMDLLPAPFPIADLLDPREMHHVRRLFGIGGLSYGNLSVREDATRFWMSARGVDKGKLTEIGRDVLLVTDYCPERDAMQVSVPPHVEPRGVSVDAVEHWALYSSYPGIGAIIHIHAWVEGIESTRVNFPCGTYELAREVAELVAGQPDPTRAVIGLRNHGLTITGWSFDEIFERIGGRILRQIPME
jgi:ribulose-5-phosphate 4-epimerase/fuculose-1-phosphate aldolase